MPRRLTDNSNDDKRRKASSSSSQRNRRGSTAAGEESGRRRSRSAAVPEERSTGADIVKDTLKKTKEAPKRVASKPVSKEISHEKAEEKTVVESKTLPEKTYETLPHRAHKKASHAKRSTARVVSDAKSADKINKKRVSAEIRNNFIKLGVMVAVGVGIIIGIYYGIQNVLERQSGFTDVKKTQEIEPYSTQVPRQRNGNSVAESSEDEELPNPAVIRDISYGARDIQFKERQINIPGIYDNELLFSAGTGSLYVGGNVLSKLYLYNLDAGDETLIAKSDIYAGEFYETLVNHRWLIWLETDHGTKNYIMVMNRSTGKVSKIQSFKEGQPKLNLYGDLLVWMEQVSDTQDRLMMFDLDVQEPLPLHTFTDKATYGVSSPYIYENTIVWSDRDPTQTEEERAAGEKSAIYYLNLKTDESGSFEDPKYYIPGTYVHEPLYNGDVFVWLDANKSPQSNLYIGRAGEQPKKIAKGVTTYSIGDGIVVYGKDQAVWVYVIATDELCRLTSPGEMGMLPAVTKRTVVWYNLTADSEKDVLRFKVLTDEELYPGGMD